MKLETRIYFRTMYVERHHSISHEGTFYEPIVTDIPELSPEDAPVATVVNGEPLTRWYGHRHFARSESLNELSLEKIRNHIEWHALYGLTEGYECFDHGSRATLYPPANTISYNEEPRNRAMELARTCFDRVLMVDGEFWIECAEPYLIQQDYSRELSIKFPSAHSKRPNHRSHTWLFHSHVLRADDPAAANHISILIPESIRRQPERDTIMDAATFLLEDYSHCWLKDIHLDVMRSLTTLHRTFYGACPENVDCDTLIDPINALLDAVEDRETEPRIARPDRLAAYRNCVSRWLDRDVSAADIVRPGAKTPVL